MKEFFESYLFIFLFLALVLWFWVLGLWLSLYYVFWWYDIVAHFLGGVWIAASALILKNRFGLALSGRLERLALLIAVLGIVALAGVTWEFLEFIGDRYIFRSGFTYLPNVFEDTLLDLFMDLIGGIAGYLIFRKNG